MNNIEYILNYCKQKNLLVFFSINPFFFFSNQGSNRKTISYKTPVTFSALELLVLITRYELVNN